MEKNGADDRRGWHVGKEIPIATILVLLFQTAGVIWWAASTSAKVDNMEKASLASQITQAQVDRRQDDESQRSETRIMTQLDKLGGKIDRLIEAKR